MYSVFALNRKSRFSCEEDSQTWEMFNFESTKKMQQKDEDGDDDNKNLHDEDLDLIKMKKLQNLSFFSLCKSFFTEGISKQEKKLKCR